MTAFRAAFKAYRMHQVLILPRFARLTIALGLATAVFPVDAEYYFNPRFLSNDLAESVDLSAFTKGREAPPGTYRVDIYLNDELLLAVNDMHRTWRIDVKGKLKAVNRLAVAFHSPTAFIEKADEALYLAKKQGKNQLAVYASGTDGRLQTQTGAAPF